MTQHQSQGSLTLDNVSKSFDDVKVLKSIHLQVEQGEFCVFVGPSGCGKSTLLRIIAGLEELTSGDVSIDGQVINHIPPSKREIAMVFQSYALYPHLNVRDNMGLGLKQSGVDRQEIAKAVDRAATMLDLQAYVQRRPAELSGGQRQRVAIGRAIVRKPKLFLFDEPLSNLDAALRVQTRLEIANLHRELQTTMIYVTHDQTEAMTLADKIVVMRSGQIEQVGSPMALYNNPINEFVAGFIGSPKMNFLEASLINQPGKTLGIRPEHLSLSRESGMIAGQVSHIEQLGSETLVYVQAPDHPLITVRLFDEVQYGFGDQVWVSPHLSRAFHFDDNGLRIMPNTSEN